MRRSDFVSEIGCLAKTVGLDEDRASAFQEALRREYGGKTVTIERRPPVTIDDVNDALREYKSVRVVSREVGLSRSTIYRMLASRKSQQPTS